MYCTVLGVLAVLTDTEAGDVGVDVTVTKICWPPPLPGAWAMQPAKGKRTAATSKQGTTEDENFRTGPSDGEKAIENVGGRRREVYSVMVMLSRSMRTVKWMPRSGRMLDSALHPAHIPQGVLRNRQKPVRFFAEK